MWATALITDQLFLKDLQAQSAKMVSNAEKEDVSLNTAKGNSQTKLAQARVTVYLDLNVFITLLKQPLLRLRNVHL